MDKSNWALQPGVTMDETLASDVARIACALKSLSVFTMEALEDNEPPETLKQIVDDGTEAMKRIFVW